MTMNKNKKVKKPVTAAELMKNLLHDPEFVRRQEAKHKSFNILEEQFARAERPLVEALNNAGVSVKSVWDLVNAKESYRLAIPVLIAHLRYPFPYRIREGIARALTVKNAGDPAFIALVDEFRKQPDSTDAAQHGFKWALGNAISIVANRNHFDEIVELIRDRRHGSTREMLILRLADLDGDRAIGVLIQLLADEDVIHEALIALGKLKAHKARRHIERLLDHPKFRVRKEAKKALTELDN